MMQLSAGLSDCSFVSSSTSQVAKLCWQKYWPGMPAVRISSSNVFFKPTNLLVLISMISSEIMRGFRASDNSGMGKIILSWKYGAYLTTLSLSYSYRLFCGTFQEAGVLLFISLCPGCIGLPEGTVSCVFPGKETGRAGQIALLFLATHSFDLVGKAFLEGWDVCQPSESSGETPKRIWELFGESIISGSCMVVKGHQEGTINYLYVKT